MQINMKRHFPLLTFIIDMDDWEEQVLCALIQYDLYNKWSTEVGRGVLIVWLMEEM